MVACPLRGGGCPFRIDRLRQGEGTETVSALCHHDAGFCADDVRTGAPAWEESADEPRRNRCQGGPLCAFGAICFRHDTFVTCL